MTPIEIYSKILKLMMPGYHKSLKLWAKTKAVCKKGCDLLKVTITIIVFQADSLHYTVFPKESIHFLKNVFFIQ